MKPMASRDIRVFVQHGGMFMEQTATYCKNAAFAVLSVSLFFPMTRISLP